MIAKLLPEEDWPRTAIETGRSKWRLISERETSWTGRGSPAQPAAGVGADLGEEVLAAGELPALLQQGLRVGLQILAADWVRLLGGGLLDRRGLDGQFSVSSRSHALLSFCGAPGSGSVDAPGGPRTRESRVAAKPGSDRTSYSANSFSRPHPSTPCAGVHAQVHRFQKGDPGEAVGPDAGGSGGARCFVPAKVCGCARTPTDARPSSCACSGGPAGCLRARSPASAPTAGRAG